MVFVRFICRRFNLSRRSAASGLWSFSNISVAQNCQVEDFKSVFYTNIDESRDG